MKNILFLVSALLLLIACQNKAVELVDSVDVYATYLPEDTGTTKCMWRYSEHYMQHHFVKRRVVENITGVRLPRYKVLNQGEEGRRASRFPDRTYDFTLEFNKMPDEAFYKELDEHFDSFEPGKYSYSAIWGNGIEAPKGESDKDDINFSIAIERGSKTFHISVGEW